MYLPGVSVTRVETGLGTGNENAAIQTDGEKYLLKKRNPRYSARNRIIFENALQHHLRRAGLPVAPPLPSLTGNAWVEIDGHVYQLYPFVDGAPFNRDNIAHLREAGEKLALFHTATNDFDPPESKNLERYDDPAVMRRTLDEAAPAAAEADRPSLELIRSQLTAIARAVPDSVYRRMPAVIVHGDYHPVNVSFSGDAMNNIMDFDWASRQPAARDIADGILYFSSTREAPTDIHNIVCMTRPCTFTADGIGVFLDAYTRIRRLTPEERSLLPVFARARWLNCRIDGMRKIPDQERIPFLLHGLFATIESFDAAWKGYISHAF